jgi:hypothetical protein
MMRVPRFVLVLALLGLMAAPACVRRTISITTEPPNARVFLNDQEIGSSPVTTDFLWYGDYEVDVRKDGYETLQTSWKIDAPWYQVIPIDFFAEVLWPGQLHDYRQQHYVLKPSEPADTEELLKRAGELRDQALEVGK